MTESIHLFYGNDEFLVNNQITQLIDTLQIDPINVIRYDLLENEQQIVLEEIQTVSFFAEKKVVVVKNFNLILKESEQIIQTWINYLENPNEDVILIIFESELLSELHPLGKAVFLNASIKKIESVKKDDYPKYVENLLSKYNYDIEKDATLELLDRTSYDFHLITQEIDKLMLFCYENKEITKKDVMLLVSRNLEENIYELTNAMVKQNINKAIEVFYDLIARNEEPLRILSQLASKFRELLHVKLLLEKGYTQEQVSKHFNMSSGKAYYVMKAAKDIGFIILEDYIKRLSQLDFDIKSGNVDKKIGLEMFLLGA